VQAIIKAFRKAVTLAVQLVKDASVSIEGKDPEDKKSLLQKCASTTLNSKLVIYVIYHASPDIIPLPFSSSFVDASSPVRTHGGCTAGRAQQGMGDWTHQ